MAKRMTAKDLAGLVKTSVDRQNPTPSTAPTPVPGQNVNGTTITVRLEQIRAYGKNPRRVLNEKYLEIKESIRARGLEQIFSITKRPGDDHYTLGSGGKTRLTALNELYEETGDPKYATLSCPYIEYQSESDLLLRHISENEDRSEMVFWDKACAIIDLQTQMEMESGQSYSPRELEAILKERGMKASRTNLISYRFAADYLADLGRATAQLSSMAVRNHLHPTFNRLRKIAELHGVEDAAFLKRVIRPPLEAIAMTFELESKDNIELLPAITQEWQAATASLIGVDIESISPMMAAVAKNQQVALVDLQGQATADNSPALDHGGEEVHDQADDANGSQDALIESSYTYSKEPGDGDGDTQPKTVTSDRAVYLNQKQIDEGIENTTSSKEIKAAQKNISEDALIQDVFEAAKGLAEIAGIGDCIKASDTFPLGFWVELPAFNFRIGGIDHPYAHPAWWLLANLSEQFGTNAHHLPDESLISKARSDEDQWIEAITDFIGDPVELEFCGFVIEWVLTSKNELVEVVDPVIALLLAIRQLQQEQFSRGLA